MAESEDDSSKTEEPSQKKLEEARKKGQIASSRELTHFFMMGAFLAFILWMMKDTSHDTIRFLAPFITQPDNFEVSPGGITQLLRKVVFGFLAIIAFPMLLTIVAALAPAILQRKIVFTTENMKPKLSKISPLGGFKRLFGMKALVEFLKNFLKVFVIGVICLMVVMPYKNQLPHLLHASSIVTTLEYSQTLSTKILTAVCIFLFFLGILDYIYQRFMIMKSLRMSKQELKDEYKQQEGDPHVKGRLRQVRRERARKRMMANVPKADVVITNPTHYAVALKYDAASMPAPVVVAKGADEVAARIRELATKHKVTILRNPPLARILYDTTEVDDEIPVEHYQAVAKIIGYVYRLKGKTPAAPPGPGKPGGGKDNKSNLPKMNIRK